MAIQTINPATGECVREFAPLSPRDIEATRLHVRNGSVLQAAGLLDRARSWAADGEQARIAPWPTPASDTEPTDEGNR